MPYRINGIGTTYLGKSSLETYVAHCDSCNQDMQLERYETRLWFTFLFIPLIPLSRKQILDYCPYCTTHRALPYDEWVRIREESIDESMQELQANKDDPEAAMQLLGTLETFHQREEAANLAAAMRKSFADNTEVQLFLGAWYEKMQQTEDADACFRRAYELEPEHPGCLRAEAIDRLQANNPEGAEELIQKLAPPSEAYDPQVFYMLASTYQAVGRHEDALRIFGQIAEASPDWVQDSTFRAKIAESERATGIQSGIAPPVALTEQGWFKAVLAAAVVLLIVGGLAYYNFHVSNNRKLHVVNGLPVPLVVKVDGKQVQVSPEDRSTLTVAEGSHRAEVVKPAGFDDVTFTMSASWFQRLFNTPAFVLDPTRSAAVVWEKVVYREVPREGDGEYKIHFGEAYTQIDDVDYLFQPFPREVKIKKGSSKTKTRVSLEHVQNRNITSMTTVEPEKQLTVLESRLTAQPDDLTLLQSYAVVATQTKQLDRMANFLQAGLDRRPIAVNWHRFFQNTAEMTGKTPEVKKYYESAIQKSPNDYALVYLRGRIEPLASTSIEYYDRSNKIKDNTYATAAKGYQLRAQGKFAEAMALINKAKALAPKRTDLDDILGQLHLALKQYAEIQRQVMEKRRGKPNAAHDHDLYMKMLAARGDTGRMSVELQHMERAYRATINQLPMQARSAAIVSALQGRIESSKLTHAYFSGNMNRLQQRMRQASANVNSNYWNAVVVLETRASEKDLSEKILAKAGQIDPHLLMAAHIKLQLAGKTAEAKKYLDAWIEQVKGKNTASRLATELLTRPKPDIATTLDLALDVRIKLVVLVAAAAAVPRDQRRPLLDLAEKLNYDPAPPQRFLKAAIGQLRTR